MKALFNPETGMVMEWTEKRCKMEHLQELLVPEGTPLSAPYDPTVVSNVEPGDVAPAIAPPAKKKRTRKRAAPKQEGEAFPSAEVKAYSADADTGDKYGVDDI